MSDRFDDLLARELAPPARDPDRAFVARVQARIRLEQRLEAERCGLLSALSFQILGIATIAAALWWLSRSPAIESFAGESPAILLLVLLAAFSFVIVLFAARSGSGGYSSDLSEA